MAAGKQGQNQGRNNGGSDSAREQVRDVAGKVRDQAQEFGSQVRENLGTARDSAARGYRQAEGMVARNPSESVLVGFGVGLGLGILLAVALTQREETWYEKYAPDSLLDLPDRLRDLPDRISSEIARHLPRR